MWGPNYEKLAQDARQLGWNGSGSFWGLSQFAGIKNTLGYPCAGPNRDAEIRIVSAAIRARLNKMCADRIKQRRERIAQVKRIVRIAVYFAIAALVSFVYATS